MPAKTTSKRKRAGEYKPRQSETSLEHYFRQAETVKLTVQIDKSVHDDLLMRQKYLSEMLGYEVSLNKVVEELLVFAMDNIGEFQVWLARTSRS